MTEPKAPNELGSKEIRQIIENDPSIKDKRAEDVLGPNAAWAEGRETSHPPLKEEPRE